MFNAPNFVRNLQSMYPEIAHLQSGVCHGLSVMHVNAVLSGNVALFEELYLIMSHSTWFLNNQSFTDFNKVLTVAKQIMRNENPLLITEAQKYINAGAFCDGVLAHQGKIIELSAFSSQNIIRSTHMLLPEKLSQQATRLHKLYSDVLIGEQRFFTKHIANLVAEVQLKLTTTNKHNFSCVITSDNHVITLSYTASNLYVVFDQNHHCIQKTANIKDAVEMIFHAFFPKHEDILIASLTVYTSPAYLDVPEHSIHALCMQWHTIASPYIKQHFPDDDAYSSNPNNLNFEQQMMYLERTTSTAVKLKRLTLLPTEIFSSLEKIYCVNYHAQQALLSKQHSLIANKHGSTTVLLACMGGHLLALDTFLEHYSDEFNQLSKQSAFPPLYCACLNGHLALVRRLLKQPKLNADLATKAGETPFYAACQRGHIDVVRMLATNPRVNLNQKNKAGYSPFLAACMYGHVNVVHFLLADISINIEQNKIRKESPLYLASLCGHADVVALLLATPRAANSITPRQQASPFSAACSKGYLAVISIMLANFQVDVNQKDCYGYTPFLRACMNGHVEVVLALLASFRVRVNQTIIKEAIIMAYQKKQHQVIDALISQQRVPIKHTGEKGIIAIPNVFNQHTSESELNPRASKKCKLVHDGVMENAVGIKEH